MKRVSFEVAKYLKEIGYPQEIWKYCWFYNESGELLNISITGYYGIPAPTYLEVWLWLWREKKIYIGLEAESYPHDGMCVPSYIDAPYSDPEDALIAAIEYLVNNKILK